MRALLCRLDCANDQFTECGVRTLRRRLSCKRLCCKLPPMTRTFNPTTGNRSTLSEGVYFRTGKIDEARNYFQQATKVREQVTAAHPRDWEAARVFANSVMNIGSTYLARQEHEQAIPLLDTHQEVIRMARVEEFAQADPELAAQPGDGVLSVGHRASRNGGCGCC